MMKVTLGSWEEKNRSVGECTQVSIVIHLAFRDAHHIPGVRSWEVKMRKGPCRDLAEHGSVTWVRLGSAPGQKQETEREPDTHPIQVSGNMHFNIADLQSCELDGLFG